MTSEIDIELQKIHDDRIRLLSENGLLEIEEKYWRKRSERAAYSIVEIVDARATDMVKGQISICHETADEALRALKAANGKANPDDVGKIPAQRTVAV